MSINDFADELLQGERSGKYSPIEVAQWLEDLAGAAQPVKARRVELPWLRGHWLDRLPAIDAPGASIDVVVGSQREELAQIVREHHLFK
jgi:hypothetical protein